MTKQKVINQLILTMTTNKKEQISLKRKFLNITKN